MRLHGYADLSWALPSAYYQRHIFAWHGQNEIVAIFRLMENIRVKRAGYAFRQIYQQFLFRYKMLAEETWPSWEGDPQEGVRHILTNQEIPQDEYAFGKTKIFIRNPKTVSTLICCYFLAHLSYAQDELL